MFKGKLVALSLIAAALLCWQVLPVATVNSGIVDPCSSTASSIGGCYFLCPQGDAQPLNNLQGGVDATISVQAKDNTGAPIPGIPASDGWLIGCEDNLVLCGGSGAINFSAATDANGETTFVGSLAASGCDTLGVSVVIQGVIVADPINCNNRLCLNLPAKSPDLMETLDGVVDLLDQTAFSFGYTSPPRAYRNCYDFTCDGLVDLLDFTAFGFHYLHNC